MWGNREADGLSQNKSALVIGAGYTLFKSLGSVRLKNIYF